MKRIVVIVLFTIFYGYSVERCAVCLGDYPKKAFALENYDWVCPERLGDDRHSDNFCSSCMDDQIKRGYNRCFCRQLFVRNPRFSEPPRPPKCWDKDCVILCSLCLFLASYAYSINDFQKEYEELHGKCPLCLEYVSHCIKISDGIPTRSCYMKYCPGPQYKQVVELEVSSKCIKWHESEKVEDFCYTCACACVCIACGVCLKWWDRQGRQYCDEVAMPEIKDRIRQGREYIGAIVQQPRALMEGREHQD